jgi:hypothetical protein
MRRIVMSIALSAVIILCGAADLGVSNPISRSPAYPSTWLPPRARPCPHGTVSPRGRGFRSSCRASRRRIRADMRFPQIIPGRR